MRITSAVGDAVTGKDPVVVPVEGRIEGLAVGPIEGTKDGMAEGLAVGAT